MVEAYQDIAARYGGDEFVVFMTYKQEDDIREIVQRIFDSVSCQYEGHDIGISMGICLSSACDGGYYDLYKKRTNPCTMPRQAARGAMCITVRIRHRSLFTELT